MDAIITHSHECGTLHTTLATTRNASIEPQAVEHLHQAG